MVLLLGLHRFLEPRNSACKIWYIDKSDQNRGGLQHPTTTPNLKSIFGFRNPFRHSTPSLADIVTQMSQPLGKSTLPASDDWTRLKKKSSIPHNDNWLYQRHSFFQCRSVVIQLTLTRVASKRDAFYCMDNAKNWEMLCRNGHHRLSRLNRCTMQRIWSASRWYWLSYCWDHIWKNRLLLFRGTTTLVEG